MNEEMCCEQCCLPVPLLCWRYKLRFSLDKGRLKPVNQDNTADPRRLSPTASKQPQKDLCKFAPVDEWRDKLIAYIEQESGTFTVNDKVWLRNLYDYENYTAEQTMVG